MPPPGIGNTPPSVASTPGAAPPAPNAPSSQAVLLGSLTQQFSAGLTNFTDGSSSNIDTPDGENTPSGDNLDGLSPIQNDQDGDNDSSSDQGHQSASSEDTLQSTGGGEAAAAMAKTLQSTFVTSDAEKELMISSIKNMNEGNEAAFLSAAAAAYQTKEATKTTAYADIAGASMSLAGLGAGAYMSMRQGNNPQYQEAQRDNVKYNQTNQYLKQGPNNPSSKQIDDDATSLQSGKLLTGDNTQQRTTAALYHLKNTSTTNNTNNNYTAAQNSIKNYAQESSNYPQLKNTQDRLSDQTTQQADLDIKSLQQGKPLTGNFVKEREQYALQRVYQKNDSSTMHTISNNRVLTPDNQTRSETAFDGKIQKQEPFPVSTADTANLPTKGYLDNDPGGYKARVVYDNADTNTQTTIKNQNTSQIQNLPPPLPSDEQLQAYNSYDNVHRSPTVQDDIDTLKTNGKLDDDPDGIRTQAAIRHLQKKNDAQSKAELAEISKSSSTGIKSSQEVIASEISNIAAKQQTLSALASALQSLSSSTGSIIGSQDSYNANIDTAMSQLDISGANLSNTSLSIAGSLQQINNTLLNAGLSAMVASVVRTSG